MRTRRSRGTGLARLAIAGSAVVLIVALVVVVLSGGNPPPLPPPGLGQPARAGDPFAYDPAHASDFVARATAGEAHVLFAKSPGGAIATARRVAALRTAIDSAASGTGVDPRRSRGSSSSRAPGSRT